MSGKHDRYNITTTAGILIIAALRSNEPGRQRVPGSNLLDHRRPEAPHFSDHRGGIRPAEVDVERRDAELAECPQVAHDVGLAAGEQPALAVRGEGRDRRAIALDAIADADRRGIAAGTGGRLAQAADARLQARQGIEQVLVVAADRIPEVADAGSAADRGAALAADPDRRIRLLDGLGLQHDAVETRVAPGEGG